MSSYALCNDAFRIVAEHKIQAALNAGEFDDLPGLGKPCALCDEPYDPFWWIRRKLERESMTFDRIGTRHAEEGRDQS